MSTSLIVWMNGQRVGVWTQARGKAAFQYAPAWAAAPDRRRLSLSLHFQPGNAEHKGAVVTDLNLCWAKDDGPPTINSMKFGSFFGPIDYVTGFPILTGQ